MKKLLIVILGFILLHTETTAQNTEDCSGGVTGMNALAITCSAVKVQFYRPLRPSKFWSNKNEKEYEANFTIVYKPYFSQAITADWIKDIDTSTKEHSFQLTKNEHSSFWEFIDLIPGMSYEFCIYTRCGNLRIGPLCHFATTSNEAPCKLEINQTRDNSASFNIKYNERPTFSRKQILLEYREKEGDWKQIEINDSYSAFISNLNAGSVYYARVKFVYYNDVVSPPIPMK
ncbi:MAG: hypothetical protein IPM85_15305 [Chitinophagaceae bacterium]|nr:hypothetical protein [Chitinophagaceae bacterium]